MQKKANPASCRLVIYHSLMEMSNIIFAGNPPLFPSSGKVGKKDAPVKSRFPRRAARLRETQDSLRSNRLRFFFRKRLPARGFSTGEAPPPHPSPHVPISNGRREDPRVNFGELPIKILFIFAIPVRCAGERPGRRTAVPSGDPARAAFARRRSVQPRFFDCNHAEFLLY